MEHRYIGRIIQKLREERGLTQYDLAARMNTARTTVRNIEVDDCQPTLNAVWHLEEALGLPHGELVRLSYPESERLPQEPRRRGRPAMQGTLRRRNNGQWILEDNSGSFLTDIHPGMHMRVYYAKTQGLQHDPTGLIVTIDEAWVQGHVEQDSATGEFYLATKKGRLSLPQKTTAKLIKQG